MPVVFGDASRQACQSGTSRCNTHCSYAIIIIIPPHPLPGGRRGQPPDPPSLLAREVVGRVLEEKSWGRTMRFVVGDSVEASLAKWHLIERCNLCLTCSVPATILARMHRFQYNTATEIDDDNSPRCMLFCLSLQILLMLCWRCIFCVYFVCWRRSKESKIFRLMAECMTYICICWQQSKESKIFRSMDEAKRARFSGQWQNA